jgi:hypothetical protein
MSRFTHLLDKLLTEGYEVVSLTGRPGFTPQEDSSRDIVPLKELGQLKNPIT